MKADLSTTKNKLKKKLGSIYLVPLIYVLVILMGEFFKRNESGTAALVIIIFFTLAFYFMFFLIAFESIAEASATKRSNISAVMRICESIIVTLIFFSILYLYIYKVDPSSFKGNVGDTYFSQFISFLYFSTITFSTIGYGDIYPVTILSRGAVIMEVIYQFVVIILVISQFTIFQNQFKEKSSFTVNNKKDDA